MHTIEDIHYDTFTTFKKQSNSGDVEMIYAFEWVRSGRKIFASLLFSTVFTVCSDLKPSISLPNLPSHSVSLTQSLSLSKRQVTSKTFFCRKWNMITWKQFYIISIMHLACFTPRTFFLTLYFLFLQNNVVNIKKVNVALYLTLALKPFWSVHNTVCILSETKDFEKRALTCK